MTWLHAMVALMVAQRLAELAFAAANTRRLLRQGAVEAGARHYPLFVVLHASWLAALLLTTDAATPPSMPLLALLALVEVARAWVLASLGSFFTTRIITLPGAPLVRRGPYRFMAHPNYAVVVAEIALLPLAFGNWQVALAWSLANAALLRHRIAVEDEVLAARRGD